MALAYYIKNACYSFNSFNNKAGKESWNFGGAKLSLQW